jgi:hypothetical protein
MSPAREPSDRPDDPNRTMQRDALKIGVLGAAFSILFLLSLWLLNAVPKPRDDDQVVRDFYAGDQKRTVVIVGLYLLPLSAIAFIWFLASVRQWVAKTTPIDRQVIGTVQLLSGFAFITLALASSAATIIPAAAVELSHQPLDPALARQFPLFGNALLLVFGIRMAAMFVMTTANLGRQSAAMPKWFVFASFALAIVLLLSYSLSIWLVVGFPVWVLVLGVLIIQSARNPEENRRRREAAGLPPLT